MTLCTICGHRPHTCVESPSGEAAPPPAGVLHPLAVALLDATEALAKDTGLRHLALCDAESAAYRAWSAADFPRYTAAPPTLPPFKGGDYTAPPTLSAEERKAAALRDCAHSIHELPPEPATVEPVCAGPFVDARNCPVHAKDLRAPASPPARPPAVTRTLPEEWWETKDALARQLGNVEALAVDLATSAVVHERQRIGTALLAYCWEHKVQSIPVDVLRATLDEDEARRDADRRERE